jgi:hypothetical protein
MGETGRSGALAGNPMTGASDNEPLRRSDIDAQAVRLAAARTAASEAAIRGAFAAWDEAGPPTRRIADTRCSIDPNLSVPAPDPAMLGANREIGVNSMN